jgi:hypothetical protein
MEAMSAVMDAMNPQIIFDLEKFYPRTFEKFKKHKNTFLLDVIKNNLIRGIKEELYRPDIDIDIVAKFRLESSFTAFNQDVFPMASTVSLRYRMKSTISIFTDCNRQGKKIIEKIYPQQESVKSIVL